MKPSFEDFDHQLKEYISKCTLHGGLDAATEEILHGIKFNPEILALSQKQPEQTLTLEKYLSNLVSKEQVKIGKEKVLSEAETFQKIKTIGLPIEANILCSIWGVETRFGSIQGSYSTLESLATLAFTKSKRNTFFLRNLAAALTILQNQIVHPDEFKGSWAGAMGHTQFMPETYLEWGIDIRGERYGNIWGDNPEDALASTANYLIGLGWKYGQKVISQVRINQSEIYYDSNSNKFDFASNWVRRGVEFLDLDEDDQNSCAIITPVGKEGPSFAVFENFQILLQYNHSFHYAIAVALLSEEVEGKSEWDVAWPRENKVLTREEIIAIQKGLVELGYDTGDVDGLLGSKTRRSIQNYQQSIGEIPDGFPTKNTLITIFGKH